MGSSSTKKNAFGVNEILFLGDKLSAEGIKADKEKANAILKMQEPTDKTCHVLFTSWARLKSLVNLFQTSLQKHHVSVTFCTKIPSFSGQPNVSMNAKI